MPFFKPLIRLPLALMTLIATSAGAQALNKDNFHEYLHALETVNSEQLEERFYHADFSIALGEDTMDVAALLEYEQFLKSLVDFSFDVHQIVADESGIAIDATETFIVKQNADVPNIGPARAGERYELRLNVFYSLTDGKISSITANVLSVEKGQPKR